ncbi:MAG: uracil-DNA glycosylase [Nanoarchaeota archaeon]
MDKNKKLKELKLKIINELECSLKVNSNNIVFGKGNIDAKIMLIGEAPGVQEDLQGIPFCGRSGKELNKLLNHINLNIDDVYITNILKYRPQKNQNPTIEQIKNHTPYLIEQIKIIKPKIIVTLGNYSTKFVLSGFEIEKMIEVDGISKIHGILKNIKFNNSEFIVMPIYHPAAMLYKPQLKEDFQNDFEKIKKIIDEDLKN